ncbi:hypothetical protein RHGRI_015043 [Rhododendron griersonianum]|uniref:NAC domain-containing protein n=1 Tax=Rhododendron griersonianum TaxID=479676 RepID=A0AAV6KBR5_9ERIC|nr:hypothetical protein RHGRI_015043 [Rhododendron griersonianum]
MQSTPASIIAEVDLYKFNPWELPRRKALFGEEEWYFFTPRDRKYPNGVRPNRMAGPGYWKATGTDKPIVSSRDATILGVKKGLVFYIGRPPRGIKTDWSMHEYRMPQATMLNSRQKGLMRVCCFAGYVNLAWILFLQERMISRLYRFDLASKRRMLR